MRRVWQPASTPRSTNLWPKRLEAERRDDEKNTGIEIKRAHVDKGYRGQNHPNKYRIWITGQVRRTTVAIKREMKHRAAVEPIIGHMKAEHRMDRNYLKGRDGDRINAVMAAVGFNFHLLFRWLQSLLRAWIQALLRHTLGLQSVTN